MINDNLNKFLKDASGSAAIMIALVMPIFIGGLGFGVETGYWYFNHRKLQNAADVAAYAAATELRAGHSRAQQGLAAVDAATRTGYVASRGTIISNWPPDDGAYLGDAAAVEISVEERLPRMFSAIFLDGDVSISGRAVARVSEGVPTCVLALEPTAAGAVTFTGSTDTILVGCNVHSNSISANSAVVTGSADVQTDCLSTSGNVRVSASLSLTNCVAPYEHADVVPDPYAAIAAPAVPPGGLPSPANTPQSHITISPGTYNSLDLKGTVHLNPGVYVLKGDLKINAQATVTGEGVTIYFNGSSKADFDGGASIQLSAPSAGAYAGMLFFGARNANNVVHKINGNSSSHFNGAIYARDSQIQMNGGGRSVGGCTQVVARTIVFSGNSQVGMDCTGWAVQDIRSSRLITLVE